MEPDCRRMEVCGFVVVFMCFFCCLRWTKIVGGRRGLVLLFLACCCLCFFVMVFGWGIKIVYGWVGVVLLLLVYVLFVFFLRWCSGGGLIGADGLLFFQCMDVPSSHSGVVLRCAATTLVAWGFG
jgi:hypothetical protein